MTTSSFPPPYSVRISKKAKRITLRIRPGIGLEVVLPASLRNYNVTEVLEKFKPWIIKHYAKFVGQNPPLPDPQSVTFPQGFFLDGGRAAYLFTQNPEQELTPGEKTTRLSSLGGLFLPPHTLELVKTTVRTLPLPLWHSPSNPKKTYKWLQLFIKKYAYDECSLLIRQLTEQHSFPPTKLVIKFLTSRWGSCSIARNININACLAFLPPELRQYIVVHELCHTRAMNHSDAFWKEVFSVMPNALALDSAMRKAWAYVPFWAMK